MTDTVFVVEPRHIVSIDVHRVIDEAAPAAGDTITPTRMTWRGTVTLRVRFRPNRHIELAGRTYRIRSCFDDRDRFGPGVYTYRIEEARPGSSSPTNATTAPSSSAPPEKPRPRAGVGS